MIRVKLQNNQHGFAAIIVALVLIAIISMIVLGFAFAVRQNQRNTLNRQLSTQAFYAAETGVNDAIKNLSSLSDSNNCNNAATVATAAGASQDLGGGVRYTCVLINKAPDNLTYDSIGTDSSTVARILTTTPIATLRFSWQDAGGSTTFAPATSAFPLPNLPTLSGSCAGACDSGIAQFPNNTGILRTTIIPANSASSTDSLLNNSQTIFMYPIANTSSAITATTFRSGGDLTAEGVFATARCRTANTPLYCRHDVNVSARNATDFYVRIKSIYKNSSVVVQALDASGNLLPISGSQAMIDSTGRAADVVRRIQVRVPIHPGYYFPEFGIETGNTICKRLAVWPGGATIVPPETTLTGNNATRDAQACALP